MSNSREQGRKQKEKKKATKKVLEGKQMENEQNKTLMQANMIPQQNNGKAFNRYILKIRLIMTANTALQPPLLVRPTFSS